MFQSCENRGGVGSNSISSSTLARMSATPPAGMASLKLARSNRQSPARKRADRFGDVALRLICLGAAVLAALVLVLIDLQIRVQLHHRSRMVAAAGKVRR
jgi:hypothetical protein